MLELVHIDYGFGTGSFALKDISLKVNRGERVCLLGLNGSGKSTLLKLAAGIISPSAGDVILDGVIRNSEQQANQARGLIGFIFQNPDDQILTASVETELAFALENLRVDREEIVAQVAQQAAKFGLLELLNRHPATLSAGEKQRLALASTLISQPQVMILDEPSSYLDQDGRALLRRLVFSTRDFAVLASTQHIDELQDYDRVIYLENGAIEFAGSLSEFESSHLYREICACQRSSRADVSASKALSPSVSAQRITFAYPGETACLHSLEAHFPAGKVTVINGASGSGKSTLALIIAGLLKPDAGGVMLDTTISSENERLERVGMIFQLPEASIFADTVFEEIAFGLRNQGMKDPELSARVERALSAVDLDPKLFLQRNPFTLSAGEQRLIGIASIIALNREVVIFDESIAGLDWRHTRQVRELIFDLKKSGKTVIVITHDSAFQSQIADRTALL